MLTLPDNASVVTPARIKADDWVMVVTDEPQMLVFKAEELPTIGKGKGSKLAKMPKGQQVTAVFAFEPGSKLTLVAGKYEKTFGPTAIEEAFSSRAKRGVGLPRTLKTGH